MPLEFHSTDVIFHKVEIKNVNVSMPSSVFPVGPWDRFPRGAVSFRTATTATVGGRYIDDGSVIARIHAGAAAAPCSR